MTKSTDSKTKASFIQYLHEHQGERFYQALRNWSGYAFIYGSNERVDDERLTDTFYLEDNK